MCKEQSSTHWFGSVGVVSVSCTLYCTVYGAVMNASLRIVSIDCSNKPHFVPRETRSENRNLTLCKRECRKLKVAGVKSEKGYEGTGGHSFVTRRSRKRRRRKQRSSITMTFAGFSHPSLIEKKE
jgi:hypothetical protein